MTLGNYRKSKVQYFICFFTSPLSGGVKFVLKISGELKSHLYTISGRSTDSPSAKRGWKPIPPSDNTKVPQQTPDSQEQLTQLDKLNPTVMLYHADKAATQVSML